MEPSGGCNGFGCRCGCFVMKSFRSSSLNDFVRAPTLSRLSPPPPVPKQCMQFSLLPPHEHDIIYLPEASASSWTRLVWRDFEFVFGSLSLTSRSIG